MCHITAAPLILIRSERVHQAVDRTVVQVDFVVLRLAISYIACLLRCSCAPSNVNQLCMYPQRSSHDQTVQDESRLY